MCGVIEGITLGLQGLSGMMQASGQAAQGKAEAKAYEAQAAASEQNAKLAQIEADNARQRGMVEEEKSNKEFEQLQGTQKAAMAANGLDTSSESLSMVLQDTVRQREEEGTWIRKNAEMEKWGFLNEKTQHLRDADMQKAAAKNAKKAGKMNAFSTLLGTAASIGISAYGMSGKGNGAPKERKSPKKPKQ